MIHIIKKWAEFLDGWFLYGHPYINLGIWIFWIGATAASLIISVIALTMR